MLLLITGFLVMGFSQVSGTQTNFDPHAMYLLSLDPMRDGYSPEKTQALFEKLPQQLKRRWRQSVTSRLRPSRLCRSRMKKMVPCNSPRKTPRNLAHTACDGKESVGAGYFSALSEAMLAGREFVELDQRTDSAEIQGIACCAE